MKNPLPESFICQRCSIAFANKYRRRNKPFCSAKCYHEAKADNGKIIGNTKKCSKCDQYKVFSLFPKQPTGRAGLHSYCKECSSSYFHEMRGTPTYKRQKYIKRGSLSEEERTLNKKEYHKRYRKENKEKVRMWNKVRVYRLRAAGDMPHYLELEAKLCEQDYKCVYCLGLLNKENHLDHKTPISRGGKNDDENLQWLCKSCNLKKGTNTHEEYLEKLAA